MALELLTSSIYGTLTTYTALQIHRKVNDPYMDEIFHVPQAQKYCQGDFLTWDPKITTLPGLYFITIGVLNPLSKWSHQWLCNLANLRLVNVAFATLNFLVLSRLIQRIHRGKHVRDLFRKDFLF